MTEQTPFRSMREAAGISLREVSRQTGINPGRLSIIERGVPPTDDERGKLNRYLADRLIGQQPTGETA